MFEDAAWLLTFTAQAIAFSRALGISQRTKQAQPASGGCKHATLQWEKGCARLADQGRGLCQSELSVVNLNSSEDERVFALAVKRHFGFLEDAFGFKLKEIQTKNGDPRDTHIIAKYRSGETRINVEWIPIGNCVSVWVRLDVEELLRSREGYVGVD